MIGANSQLGVKPNMSLSLDKHAHSLTTHLSLLGRLQLVTHLLDKWPSVLPSGEELALLSLLHSQQVESKRYVMSCHQVSFQSLSLTHTCMNHLFSSSCVLASCPGRSGHGGFSSVSIPWPRVHLPGHAHFPVSGRRLVPGRCGRRCAQPASGNRWQQSVESEMACRDNSACIPSDRCRQWTLSPLDTVCSLL